MPPANSDNNSVDEAPLLRGGHIIPKTLLSWMQIILAALALAAACGSYAVQRDRQDTLAQTVKDIQVDRRDKLNDYEGLKRDISAKDAQFNAFVEQQKSLNLKLEQHLLDKTIHVSEDQMRNLVGTQIQDLKVAMGKIEVTSASQQKQLDRLEAMTTQVLNAVQQKQLSPAPPADR